MRFRLRFEPPRWMQEWCRRYEAGLYTAGYTIGWEDGYAYRMLHGDQFDDPAFHPWAYKKGDKVDWMKAVQSREKPSAPEAKGDSQ